MGWGAGLLIVGVDTETDGFTGPVWSAQYSMEPGHARVALADNHIAMGRLKVLLEDRDTLTVVHNALFDIPMLARLAIHPHRVADTMVMAYLLGEASLSLKTLAYRHAGLEMEGYLDVVGPESDRMALAYLYQVIDAPLPDPEPEIVRRTDGEYRWKFPRTTQKKTEMYLIKALMGTATLSLSAYWGHKDRADDRARTEPLLGPMPQAYLRHIPRERAVRYAAMDADATRRIYFPLWERIVEEGMEDVFWRDMGIVPMLCDMMATGMLIDVGHFEGLKVEYDACIAALDVEIEAEVGHPLNANSPLQVLDALTARHIPVTDTNADTLAPHRNDKLVRLIQDVRAYRKLLGTYIEALPRLIAADGRIHTKLSMTRTATGRLASSNPNLQNQPVRSEDGRRIRQGFVSQ